MSWMSASRRLPSPALVAALVLLVVLGVLGRLLPHAPNLTPVAAAGLFASFLCRSRWTAALVPISTMLVTDWVLGFSETSILVAVYFCLALSVVLGGWLRSRLTTSRVVLASLAGSSLFFLVTNFVVWLTWSSMYDRSLSGLGLCYHQALPFFRNTLIGDLGWSLGLFGAYGMALSWSRSTGIARAEKGLELG